MTSRGKLLIALFIVAVLGSLAPLHAKNHALIVEAFTPRSALRRPEPQPRFRSIQ
jgi:hypothetical protein